MCLEQGVPSLQPAASRQLVRPGRVQETRDVTLWIIYLHMQTVYATLFASANIFGNAQERTSMSSELHPDLDWSLSRQFAAVADDDRVTRTVAALEANGISALRAANAGEAKRIVLGLLPAGSQVHHGASQSLEVSGILEEIERPGRYEPLRPRMLSMDSETQSDEIRRLGSSPDVMLGSVHAVTETGSLLTASMSGSQLGPYASGAGKVILVVGTQKIVSDLEEGLRRINEYALPLEDARAQAAYGIHSAVNMVLIVNREIVAERITVVLDDEALGF
jgi:hypothetical protein